MITFSKSTIPEVVAAQIFKSGLKLDYNMFTTFYKPDLSDSKELYFKLNNSLNICASDYQSQTFKFAGIYAIFKGGICYYVGQSQNLASRLSQHLSGKYQDCDKVKIFMPQPNGFSKFYFQPKDDRRQILENNEMLLMSILKPVENLITPKSDFLLDDRAAFDCFITDDEDYFLEADSVIHLDKVYISVSNSETVYFDDVKCLSYYNSVIIDTVEDYGVDVARENLCHG